MGKSFGSVLQERVSSALPKDFHFWIHHFSSYPTPCSAIFSAAPGYASEETLCESHFLIVSVEINGSQVQAFALEVLIYTTETLTTLFVSKADSTGYLHHVKTHSGAPSPLRTVAAIFFALLIERKRRDGTRLVFSLFARAQDQYLFPGSVENSQKHVLDDRGLIRWWCRILDLVLQAYPAITPQISGEQAQTLENNKFRSHGYLRVPGCDTYETKAFLPDHVRRDTSSFTRWSPSDPLRAIGKPAGVPERCLIPRFPDDPKARFVIDLDDELPGTSSSVQESPSKGQAPGKWRSVKSLEQFWEMMAFRQECAAGRLVGFMWGVLTPMDLVNRPFDAVSENNEITVSDGVIRPSLPIPLKSQIQNLSFLPPQSPLRESSPPLQLPPSPFASSRVQPPESQSGDPSRSTLVADRPQSDVRGTQDLGTSDFAFPEYAYTRVVSRLQELDYASLALATESTRKWLDTATAATGLEDWAFEVVGSREIILSADQVTVNGSTPTVLGGGLLRKKKRSGSALAGDVEEIKHDIGFSVLGAGLVRKKPKAQVLVATQV